VLMTGCGDRTSLRSGLRPQRGGMDAAAELGGELAGIKLRSGGKEIRPASEGGRRPEAEAPQPPAAWMLGRRPTFLANSERSGERGHYSRAKSRDWVSEEGVEAEGKRRRWKTWDLVFG
jgi:hypothetical protein